MKERTHSGIRIDCKIYFFSYYVLKEIRLDETNVICFFFYSISQEPCLFPPPPSPLTTFTDFTDHAESMPGELDFVPLQ